MSVVFLSSRPSRPMFVNSATPINSASHIQGHPKMWLSVLSAKGSGIYSKKVINPKELEVGGAIKMNEISYNKFSQATLIKIGAATANPIEPVMNFVYKMRFYGYFIILA